MNSPKRGLLITNTKYARKKLNMKAITQEKIAVYVEKNIPGFHRNRIEKLKKLKLKEVLKRKNPYLFKVKHITTAEMRDFSKPLATMEKKGDSASGVVCGACGLSSRGLLTATTK